jgi:hypothetical protein
LQPLAEMLDDGVYVAEEYDLNGVDVESDMGMQNEGPGREWSTDVCIHVSDWGFVNEYLRNRMGYMYCECTYEHVLELDV